MHYFCGIKSWNKSQKKKKHVNVRHCFALYYLYEGYIDMFDSLPNNKILGWPKLKAVADNRIVSQKL